MFSVATREGLVAIRSKYWGQEAYQQGAQVLLAELFAEHTKEQLIPGRQTVAYELVIDDTMRAPLTLTVVANWTRAREAYFEDIRRELQMEIRSWDPRLANAEVHLTVVGAPDPNLQPDHTD